MIVLFEAIVIYLVVIGSLFMFLQWISIRHAKWRNVTAFVVAIGSAYSASFAIDIILQTMQGSLKFDNVILPVGTWLSMAVVFYFLASQMAISKKPLCMAYLIIGVIACSMFFIHSYNLLVGFPLLVIAGLIWVSPKKELA